jgi:cytochrome c oxidase assembly protein subunit 15
MTSFRRFALLSTFATYFLILVGGLVRVSGAGLGCPDWPKCFGRWIPPTSVSQLPAGIDPETFNIMHAWTEYLNRLFGVSVGFLILITAILVFKHYRTVPNIFYPMLATLFVVGFQGWYGSIVVTSELLPITITVHLLLAFLMIGLLIFATQQAYYLENPDSDKDAVYPPKSYTWLKFLAGLTLLQIVLGTQIRASIEIIQKQFPLLSRGEWLNLVGLVQNIHWVISIAMLIISWHISKKILTLSTGLPKIIRLGSWGLISCIATQIIVGIIIVTSGLPEEMQLLHLWIASLYFGVIVILLTGTKRHPKVSGAGVS